MKQLAKTLHTTLTILLFAGILAIAGLFLASVLPIPGQIEIKIVKSGSMEPTIKTGGLVIIQPQATYGVGDVITFGEDTKTEIPTTHRILEARTEGGQTFFVTKGDANEERDANEVSSREVIGSVLFSIPYAGYIVDFAKQPLGFALMIGVPAGLIILHELLGIIGEFKKLGKKEVPASTQVGKRSRREEEPAERSSPYDVAEPVLDLRLAGNKRVLNLQEAKARRLGYE